MSFAVISPSSTDLGGTSVDRRRGQPLVGRERELRWLLAGLRGAQRGAGSLIAIEGAAGIGKSRLQQEGCAAARETGMTVLATRALTAEREVGHALVRRLVRPV